MNNTQKIITEAFLNHFEYKRMWDSSGTDITDEFYDFIKDIINND